jgi:hypothetical protein
LNFCHWSLFGLPVRSRSGEGRRNPKQARMSKYKLPKQKFNEVVKSRKTLVTVIPAKAGIQ